MHIEYYNALSMFIPIIVCIVSQYQTLNICKKIQIFGWFIHLPFSVFHHINNHKNVIKSKNSYILDQTFIILLTSCITTTFCIHLNKKMNCDQLLLFVIIFYLFGYLIISKSIKYNILNSKKQYNKTPILIMIAMYVALFPLYYVNKSDYLFSNLFFTLGFLSFHFGNDNLTYWHIILGFSSFYMIRSV